MGLAGSSSLRETSIALPWRIRTFSDYRSTRTTISAVNAITRLSLCAIPILAFNRWKRTMKKYLITYPIMMGCLTLSLSIFFTYYGIQQTTNAKYPLDETVSFIRSKFMRLVPSAGYSLLIIPINKGYKQLATYLTNFG